MTPTLEAVNEGRQKIEFQCENYGTYWEPAVTEAGETPEECARRIVQHFNDTLQPGEEARTVTAVRLAPDAKASVKHDWFKLNNFTIMKPQPHDKYQCSRCRAMGKRFTLDGGVIVDYRYRSKKDCKL